MAKKIVKTPAGERITVNAPDDADDDDVLEFVENHLRAREQAKEKKHIMGMLDAQNSSIDKIEAVLEKLAARIEKVGNRELPQPNIKINPEVKVVSDPAIAAAILEMRKQQEETTKAILEGLRSMGESWVKVKHEPGAMPSFEIVHETDRHSPKFGRIVKVVPRQ